MNVKSSLPQENSANIVQRWQSQLEEAVVVTPKKKKRSWATRYTLNTSVVFALTFPLFFGRKDAFAVTVVQSVIFGFAIVLSATYLWKREMFPNDVLLGRRAWRLVVLGIAFFVIGLLQIVPMPLRLLGVFSSESAQIYQAVGSRFGTLSVEPITSFLQLLWIAALVLCGLWLISFPRESVVTSVTSSRRKKFRSASPVLRHARETDYVADVIQRTIIAVGVICSVIAVTHWALRSEFLFGIFDSGRSGINNYRAHWPFINPDHLSVLLEIAVITAFARLLRITQLRTLKGAREMSDNVALRILQSPGRFSRQLPYALALLLLVLCCVLTLSRAGNVLMIAGALVLWLVHVRSIPKSKKVLIDASAPRRKRIRLFDFPGRPYLKTVFYSAIVVFVVLFFLGQSVRDMAATRIEYGLAAGYDESRGMLSDTSLKVFADYPLFGVGLGAWNLGAAQHIPQALAGWKLDYAHNEYLQLLAETGVLGMAVVLLALALLVGPTVSAWKAALVPMQRMEMLGTGLACLLPLAHSLVDFPFHIPGLAFIFVLALVAHLRVIQRILEPKD